jgi:hypothetical protein
MINITCTVQQGSIPEGIQPKLSDALTDSCKDILGSNQGPVNISWTEVPSGFGFRGGLPSTTSLIRGSIPDGCSTDKRKKLLQRIGKEWSEITRTDVDECVVSFRDESWAG